MELRSPDQIKQFLTLSKKNEAELQAICEGLNLSTEGTKKELLDRLLSQNFIPQRDLGSPQLIALRTVDERRQPIEEAREAMLQWRKFIFDHGKVGDFQFSNNKGESYKLRMKYIRLKQETLKKILENEWYLKREYNQDLIAALKAAPENFISAVVLRKRQETNWLMLYVEPRKAA